MHTASQTKDELSRVVVCTGAIQLASAIAAMWTSSGRSKTNRNYKNHLLIHDLAAPEGQGEEFADSIRQLAEEVETWESIQYVQLPTIKRLQKELRTPGTQPRQVLADSLGVHTCDELYCGLIEKYLPTTLRRLLTEAHQICYGDGISLNFSNTYYHPRDYAKWRIRKYGKRILGLLKNKGKQLLGRPVPPSEEPPAPDEYCLLLKNLFDQKLSRVTTLNSALFVELFDKFAAHLPARAPLAHAELCQLAEQDGVNAVLLTSNFSETGRMSLEGEVDGYLEMLKRLPQGKGATLIIKPHPRDSYEKIERIQQRAASEYERTICLSDPWTFYLPFESLYVRYLAGSRRETHIAAVSSACISLEFLYGQRCLLGFGEELVAREFVPLWAPLRQVHERDLQRIVDTIRKTKPAVTKKLAA
ncbi:alpha-2,8-polysialyltransferase family protein [Blastopirellula sp. JC732]|uniref:Alpha-2,8-polysialyltransferase family protein n=1 Tax=Blastopirellula sediminis TaxID=2894196 RepID=A0A9X1SEV0_9BACT|nr:alpha-2,8-polysialyltransferase family protein [Blastopirellula sediminis]MCC9609596.1 alpha-2,8-polysialyltransferase family protein [Blastopirellula sediminis]MCC9627628.1 alpha-2,8-polysialyltransferase family protein [Blastopirellula sediminis]